MLNLLTITPELFSLTPYAHKAERPPKWVLQARCEENNADTCLFIQQLLQLSLKNKRDGKDAQNAMLKLFQVAATGLPLENFYDTKQCHEVHVFNYLGAPRKIWRIRQGSVRIYFYYAVGKVIYLAAVVAKRKDKLSSAETVRLMEEVTLYLDAQASNALAEVVLQQ